MGVVNLPSGKPTLCLKDGAAGRLAALTPPGHRVSIHVTLTDEYPLAQAQVIIEALATAGAMDSAGWAIWFEDAPFKARSKTLSHPE
jgi:holo-[acyl-carrier protein] synthase